jgi:hypothetical protein
LRFTTQVDRKSNTEAKAVIMRLSLFTCSLILFSVSFCSANKQKLTDQHPRGLQNDFQERLSSEGTKVSGKGKC